MPLVEKVSYSLLQLCRCISSGQGFPDIFRAAAGALHELTTCGYVRLFQNTGAASVLAIEFREDRTDAARDSHGGRPAEVDWVLQHGERRQGQLSGQQLALYLPVGYRREIIAVLELSIPFERRESWEQAHLDAVAALLGLVLAHQHAQDRLAELQRLQQETGFLRETIRAERDLRPLTGESTAMKAVRRAIQQVAPTDSTVLIRGETGTGKELIARAIHQLSARREHLLVTINCAALAPGVIASELFGHEPGAFTGASKRRIGRFELAHRGTIFLDEIGELPAEMQVMLLRVLQERTIERVGGHEPIPVDVRVIAATHQDLAAAQHQGRFRSDLFFRLNVFPIQVPPLRERREDIPDLVRHFLHAFARRMNKPIAHVSPATLQLLQDYPWPGNVRELENIVERAMIVSTSDTLEVDAGWLRTTSSDARPAESESSLAGMERQAILDALARCRGRVYGRTGAAAVLGLRPTTLYGKMRKHGIRKDQLHPS